jgi:hypothetical protein
MERKKNKERVKKCRIHVGIKKTQRNCASNREEGKWIEWRERERERDNEILRE